MTTAESIARARLAHDAARKCMSIARREIESDRPQEWIIRAYRSHARARVIEALRHLETWDAYRRVLRGRGVPLALAAE